MDGAGSALGGRVIARLARDLLVDDEWIVWHDAGFTWWAYLLAQNVMLDGPFEATDGALGYTLRIWTDVVRDVKDEAVALDLLASANMYQTLSALVWHPQDRCIREMMSVLVYEDTAEDWAPRLALGAVLQNAAAVARSAELAEAVGGTIAVSSHPDSGVRQKPDEVLAASTATAIPDGMARSKFAGEILNGLVQFNPAPWLVANGDGSGFTAEFECMSAVTGAEAGTGPDPSAPGTSLLQVFTDQPHPDIGSGALVVLRLLLDIPDDEVPSVTNFLNSSEIDETRVPAIGAWCRNPFSDGGVAHVIFLPSVLARHGILENIANYTAVRSRWVAAVLGEHFR